MAKCLAERCFGELLKDMEKAKGIQMNGRDSLGGTVAVPPKNDTPTLKIMDITKNQSSRYQQLAKVPKAEFEDALDTAKTPSCHSILKKRTMKES